MKQILLLLAAQFLVIGGSAAPLGTAFTYNGHLSASGTPATGLFDFRLILYNAEIGGSQVGSILTNVNVGVTNGVFTTTLDFGADVFDGDARWLELAVRPGGGSDPFDPLAPRQRITPTPYALFALAAAQASLAETLPWSGLTGVPEGFADDMDNDTTYTAGIGLTLNGAVFSIADGGIGPAQLASGAVVERALALGAVTTFALADGAVTEVKVSNGAITTGKLINGAVTTSKIVDDAISTIKLMDSSVTERKLADGAVATAKLLDDAVTGRKLADNSVSTPKLATNSVTTIRIADGAVTTSKLADGAVTSEKVTPALELNQLRAILGTFGAVSMRDDTDTETIYIQSKQFGAPGPRITLRRSDGTTETVLIDGEVGTGGGGFIQVYQANGQAALTLDSMDNFGGQASLRNASGSARLQLFGNAPNVVFGTPSDSGGIDLRDEDDVARIRLRGQNGTILLSQINGDTGVSLVGQGLAGGGLITVRQADDDLGVLVEGGTTGGLISVKDSSGTETILIDGHQNDGGSGGRLSLGQSNGQKTVIIDGEVGSGGGGLIELTKGNGTPTITLDADSGGEGRIRTQVLEITAGSDLSERFDIGPAEARPEPGMLVCIDPENPGRLSVSTRAYDHSVAGIISGAGGIKPGMLMGQAGSLADGAHPVALTGRVYCRVDTRYGAVRPGDLITTSETPGHGMKVSDRARAHGAIVGKAMTALESGKGLVLVLVSLH